MANVIFIANDGISKIEIIKWDVISNGDVPCLVAIIKEQVYLIAELKDSIQLLEVNEKVKEFLKIDEKGKICTT
jgi:hypothetical protein